MLRSFLSGLKGKTVECAVISESSVVVTFTDGSKAEFEALSIYNSWKGQIRASGTAISVDDPEIV